MIDHLPVNTIKGSIAVPDDPLPPSTGRSRPKLVDVVMGPIGIADEHLQEVIIHKILEVDLGLKIVVVVRVCQIVILYKLHEMFPVHQVDLSLFL